MSISLGDSDKNGQKESESSDISDFNSAYDMSSDGNLEQETDMACSLSYSQRSLPKGMTFAKYILQKDIWPKDGKHILAQYDDRFVIVYQAFKPSIARYAVENQRFGGPEFSYDRMSWIKTNFLWMMYRCGWASKKNQERVLAVKISRYGFERILANAYTAKLQRESNLQTYEICVRLQWDPDHSPTYDKLPRRAIQLGLKGEILKTYGTEWISSITDITDFVKSQKKVLDRDGQKELITPTERVYQVLDYNICSRIDLDVFSESDSKAMVKEQLVGGQIDSMAIRVDNSTPQNSVSDKLSQGCGNESVTNVRINHWTCSKSECGNKNFPARKRCSRCNTPRSDLTSHSPAESSTAETASEEEFTVPENLHTPPGMVVPDTQEKHSLIEKTAKFVADNGIQMEIMIKSKQGGNPKMNFLNLHDPLNFYYNHMVKMIKSGQYIPGVPKSERNSETETKKIEQGNS